MKRKRKQGYLEGTLHHMYGTYNTYKLHWFAPLLAIKCKEILTHPKHANTMHVRVQYFLMCKCYCTSCK